MKKILLLFVIFAVGSSFSVSAQFSKKELKEISKDAKAQAKKMESEGYKVFSGGLPIVRQYEEAYKLQRMKENGENMYIVMPGVAVAQSFSAAKAQAIENAKLEIAASLESVYEGEADQKLGNREISTEDASSVSTFTQGAASRISQQLGRVNVVVETYQLLPNKNVKVEVLVSYSTAKADEIAKRAARQDLEESTSKILDRVRDRMDQNN